MRGCIVFDLDGTLVDSHQDIAFALNVAMESIRHPRLETEAVRRIVGGGVQALLARALPQASEEDRARALQSFRRAYREHLLDRTRPFDGVTQAVQDLALRGFLLAVATNKPLEFTTAILSKLGFREMGVAAWAAADEVANRKPSPQVVFLAMDRAGCSVGAGEPGPSVAYVGDMPIDVQTARNGRLRSVAVSWGFDPDGARAEGPDAWAENPSALVGIAERLFG